MAEKTTPLSWSEIPLDLAGLVLCRLPAHVDRVRFAAVCPQWRVAVREVPLPPPLPLLALSDGTVYSLPGNKPLRFPACVGYADTCDNWLAFYEEGSCFLKNPFTNAALPLPGLFRVQARRRGVGGQPVGETGITWKEMEDTPRASDHVQATVLLSSAHRYIRQVSEKHSGCRLQARVLLVVSTYGAPVSTAC